MKFISGLLIAFSSGLLTSWIRSYFFRSDFFSLFVWASVVATALMTLSILLPPGLDRQVQEVLGWCLAGSVVAVAFSALMGALEDLLDA